MSSEMKKLAEEFEKSLGKKAAGSIETLEDAAEKGTNKITQYFRNLGQRVKEDLKTAFDATRVLEGAKFANDIGSGVKQVLDMERAFDRLNTRLGMSKDNLRNFKKELGQKVANTGQKLEDIIPGVETFASKGQLKDPKQLASVGEMLGQIKATTGEDTAGLSDTVVDILKNSGQNINANTIKQTLDALQATRVGGAFKTAGDAAGAIEGLTAGLSPKQLKEMGLGTRELGGLASMASRGGDQGQQILQSIMKMSTQAGGKDLVNSLLGQSVFKNGKMDVGALGKVDKDRFGKYSEQVMGSAFSQDQAGLSRFFDSLKTGMDDYKKVVSGTDEMANQFGQATDNFASKLDQFKEKSKEAGREIGAGLSRMVNGILSGNAGEIAGGLGDAGTGIKDNAGTVAGAVGATTIAALMAGGGLNSLLKKIPGGGLAKSVVGGQMAEAMGVQQVYVVNAAEIGGGGGILQTGLMGKMGGLAGMATKGLGVGAAAMGGWAIGNMINETEMGKSAHKKVGDMLFSTFGGGDASMKKAEQDQMMKSFMQFQQRNPDMQLTAEQYAKAVEEGTLRALMQKERDKNPIFTNPSSVLPQRGG
jgi:hypothetical protein